MFKQIDSSVDKTRKTLALFNKDWNTYKTNWQNANGISDKINSIFTSYNANTSVISDEQIRILRNWNNAVMHGCSSQKTFNRIIANADDNTKMYFAGLNKGKGSIEGLKKAQNVAAQSTIGLTVAQTALNMAMSFGITALISLIIKGYDELANSVENCKKRVDDLISSYKSELETANNNANRVEILADKYEKLSKGVNSLGENVSLTNAEYEEYNSLANEIAEMFPTLIQGWTDEGVAVLNLKGNIEQLRDAYKEAQQEAYNLLITSGKDSDGNDIINQWKDTQDTGFWASLLDFGADDVGGGIAVSDALNQLKAIQNMTAEEFRKIKEITNAGPRKKIAELSDIEKEIGYGNYLYKALGLNSYVTDDEFREAQRQARALIQTYNAEIESALSDVETLANAYLMTNEDYDKLDEQSKTAASMLVNSLNADIANKFSSKEDVGVYVDKIVQSILSNDIAKDALIDLFTMDTSDMPIDDIKKQTDMHIGDIAEELKENPIELKARLGFDGSDIQPLINNVQEKLQDDFDDKVGELTLEELQIAAEQIEIPEGTLLSWDELIAKIEEVQNATPNLETPFPQAWTASFTSEDESVRELGNTLLELAEEGRLTIETFNNADSSDYFKNLGISADEAVSQINRMADESRQLSSMTDQISSISEALETKQTEGFVSAGILSGFDAEVRGLESWDRFQTALGSTASSYKECQEAAGALASEWIRNSDFLAQLTEENKEYYATQLEAMGVENYEEIISYAQSLNEAKEALAQSGLMSGDATQDEIEALIAEGRYSELTASLILQLYDAKIAEQALTLDTSADCEKLIALAGDADKTSRAIQLLIQLKDIYNGFESGIYDGNRLLREEALAEVDRIKGELEAIANEESKDSITVPGVRPGARGTSAAKSAGQAAGDAYADAFEKELEDLKDLRDRGAITEKAYLDEFRRLYQRYYRDKKKYAEQYAKYEQEYLQGIKSLYESTLSGITSMLDKQIGAYEDQKSAAVDSLESERDARIEVLEAQKEQYEEQIKLIDEQIEAKEKIIDGISEEIDAIKDANEQRKREIDLEKSKYELERMMNQRTILQYSADKGMHYTQDTKGARDAKQAVEDAELEIEIAGISGNDEPEGYFFMINFRGNFFKQILL